MVLWGNCLEGVGMLSSWCVETISREWEGCLVGVGVGRLSGGCRKAV